MTNDWSLKDKRCKVTASVYRKGDIDILREKLTEDFLNWCNEHLEYTEDDGTFRHIKADEIDINDFISERIDKRFGVEK